MRKEVDYMSFLRAIAGVLAAGFRAGLGQASTQHDPGW